MSMDHVSSQNQVGIRLSSTNGPEMRRRKELFLDKFIFAGLQNLNKGFDMPSIKYFSATDFASVLQRVEKLNLGIYGIEPWKNGEYYCVVTYEAFTNDPKDSSWYRKAFENLEDEGADLQYAASYHLPEDLLGNV